MNTADMSALLVIAAAAAVSVVCAFWARRALVPAVVIDILLGLALGPQGLGWVRPGPFVSGLADLGVCLLFFMAGLEIDQSRLRADDLKRALAGWLAGLAVAVGAACLLIGAGVSGSTLVIALAASTTALGILLPILRDNRLLDLAVGRALLAAGTVGEFLPIVVLAVAFGGRAERSLLYLAVFLGAAAILALLLGRFRPAWLARALADTMESSGQLAVRLAVVLLIGLVLFAARLGFATLLGAFTAGMLMRRATPGYGGSQLRAKLDALSFGLLVPVFFVVTGVRFDLRALLAAPGALALVPLFAALFVLVRGAPALLFARRLGGRDLVLFGLFSATQLPLVVVIAQTAQQRGLLAASTASALVGAGMVSVVLYPLLGLGLRARGRAAARGDEGEGSSPVVVSSRPQTD